MAKIATVQVEGISPLSFSRHYADGIEKLPKESAKAYEERTWRNRLHVTDDGMVFIPPMAFKNSLSEIAKYLGMQIPGKGKATYTKHFEAGVMIVDPVVLPIRAEDVKGEWLFVPASGRRGDGKRVSKCFPVIPSGWKGTVICHLLDSTITPDVFESHMSEAGSFIGIGRFRPRNNGFYGRYVVKKIEWTEF